MVTKFYSLVCVLIILAPASGLAKHKRNSAAQSSGPTAQLYQLLDSSYAGKLKDYYLLADVYPDAAHPGSDFQHVLRVDYNKNRFFGRFRIYVRSIGKPDALQLKTYSIEQLYGYGEVDLEEFEKINPGPFGETGDLYLEAQNTNGPLASAPVTDAAVKQYDLFVTKYILPALQKK